MNGRSKTDSSSVLFTMCINLNGHFLMISSLIFIHSTHIFLVLEPYDIEINKSLLPLDEFIVLEEDIQISRHLKGS